MQLKIQRSQRAGGITGGTILFCLDVRADYSPEERDNIRKYRLGSQIIYNSQAARKHLDRAGAQIERTQVGTAGNRLAGVARGAFSLAMAKMSLNISIDSLGRGHHIECKDLEELLDAESTVREACKNVTVWLAAASTFNGSEIVIEYDKGQEIEHVTEVAPPLLTYAGTDSSPDEGSTSGEQEQQYRDPSIEFERWLRTFWDKPHNRKFTLYGAGALLLLLFARSCS